MQADVAWMLAMGLFIAVNIAAMRSSYTTLRAEWDDAIHCNSRISRKRCRGDNDDSGIAVDSTHTTTSATVARRHGKRRKLACRHGLPTHVRLHRRMPWPWPRHISFDDTLRFSGDLVDDIVSHPLIARAARKLKELVHSAIEELLVSCLSFVLCALIVAILRTYSTVVVGVSVDLGAFSVDI